MRKFYLLFAAMFAYTLVATAGIKNLYKQDFELAKTPADAGWISPNNADGMSIAGDEFGSYFQFIHAGGGERNAYTLWGTDIYGEGINKYTLKFDWCPKKKPDTNLANEIVVMADSTFSTNRWANQNYRRSAGDIKAGATEPDRWWLFDLTELSDEAGEGNTYAINGDSTNIATINFDSFYKIQLDVDVEARTVAYDVADEFGNPVVSGTYNVPEYVENLRATGLNVLGGKVGSINIIDNILIQVETAEDYANAPTVALTSVDGTSRTYTISFEEANNEVLHVTFDGAELTPDDTTLPGMYKFNLDASGKLVAWTESGTAKSEEVSVDVVAEIINLPAVTAEITGVDEGFVKTYKMTVSNADVPTQPALFFNYKYTPASGDVIEKENCQTGESLTVNAQGVLEITTHDGGNDKFGSTTVSYENNTEYGVKDDIDFQHMTEADLTSKGFSEIEPLVSDQMSGENNWTGRPDALRFTWIKGTNVGDTIQVRPYDVDHGGIRRFMKLQSTLTEEEAHKIFAPVYTWSTGEEATANAKFNLNIGLINVGAREDDMSGALGQGVTNAIMGVDGLTDSDYIIVNRVDNYGRGKTDYITIFADTEEEAIAQYNAENWAPESGLSVIKGTETFQLYRIDTALARVRTFVLQGESGIQVLPYNQIVSDHNAPIFNLNGVQVNAKSLKKGVYVKQGKKFIVR
ncbi:MAG: hypothetical protein IJ907_07460 [Prevotella sp.]|jgi:hypothetical protein|nr:hypothetical protein [Prevotella sp.]